MDTQGHERADVDVITMPRIVAGDAALSEVLGVPQRTIRRWRNEAELPHHQPVERGTVLYDMAEVRAWLRSRCIEVTAGDEPSEDAA